MTRTLDQLNLMNYRDLETQLENLNAFKFILPKEIKRASKLEYQNGLFFLKIYFQMKEENKEVASRLENCIASIEGEKKA